jgi:hypothetical protein
MLATLSHTSSAFCYGYFGDGVSQTICLDWPRTMTLPISASQVAWITDVSHRCLAHPFLFPGKLSWEGQIRIVI